MNKAKSLLLAVAAAAMAFTVSCFPGGDDGGGGGKGNNIGNYKTVKIGTQTWMAENLNYNASGSKCYGEGGQVIIDLDEDGNPITKTLSPSEVQANCNTYGRLYDWQTALAVCPSGWHLPSSDDWDKLFRYVDEQNGGDGEGTPYYHSYTAGKYLKAASGWNDYQGTSGNGTDKYGFSALPGGGGFDGGFGSVGNFGLWWSASEVEYSSGSAYGRNMNYDNEGARRHNNGKSYLFSVRCVQD